MPTVMQFPPGTLAHLDTAQPMHLLRIDAFELAALCLNWYRDSVETDYDRIGNEPENGRLSIQHPPPLPICHFC